AGGSPPPYDATGSTPMSSCLRKPRVNRRWSRLRLSWGLESRIAPAVFIVDDITTPDNVTNPAPGTLRYAVNQTNRNDGADEITIIRMGTIPMSASLDIAEAVLVDPFGAT